MTIRPRVLSVFFGLLAFAAAPATSHASTRATGKQPVIARITARTPADVERLARLGLDLLETREGNDFFILTSSEEIERLRGDGWAVALDVEQSANLPAPGTFAAAVDTFMGGYRTVTEMRALLDAAAAQHPGLAEVFVYGGSWERVTGGPGLGHDLFGIRLTNRALPGPKPTLFLMAAIHARELSTSELALRFVDHLLSNYGVDGDVTWLLDEHLVVVVPVVNPDGRVIAEQGYLQRKNTDTSYGGGCSVPNIGVDLNRNNGFKWGTVNMPSESKCSATYPGPVAESEPETTAVRDLVRSLFADQRGPGDTDPAPSTTTGVLLTIHSYSNLVLWPWGWTSTAAPNAADLSTIGSKFASYNGYTPQQSIELYPTSGTTDDWSYGELGIASFTFEVGGSSGTCGGFFPAFSCLDGGTGGSFWPRNLPAFLYAARIARTPYSLAQGPTPETATVVNLPPDTIEIRARFDEQVNGGQPIVDGGVLPRRAAVGRRHRNPHDAGRWELQQHERDRDRRCRPVRLAPTGLCPRTGRRRLLGPGARSLHTRPGMPLEPVASGPVLRGRGRNGFRGGHVPRGLRLDGGEQCLLAHDHERHERQRRWDGELLRGHEYGHEPAQRDADDRLSDFQRHAGRRAVAGPRGDVVDESARGRAARERLFGDRHRPEPGTWERGRLDHALLPLARHVERRLGQAPDRDARRAGPGVRGGFNGNSHGEHPFLDCARHLLPAGLRR